MSWVQEEWKSGLQSNVLIKISELEDNVEKLIKDKKCIQFQAESLQAALDNARVSEENTKKEKLDAEKNIGDLVADLEERECQLEKTKVVVKEKDIAILNLSNELSNAKRERDLEKEARIKAEKECEESQEELFDKKGRLDLLNKQLKENQEATPMIIEQHEVTKKDLEACRIENCRLNEEILKIKEERDLERKERSNLQLRLEEIEKNETREKQEDLMKNLKDKDKKIQELEREFEDLKLLSEERADLNIGTNCLDLREKISELEKENQTLLSSIDDEKTKVSSVEKIFEQDAMRFREELDEIAKALDVAEKVRDDLADKLREEREMFIIAEGKMKQEIENIIKEKEMYKSQGQEERQMSMKEEMRLTKEIEVLTEKIERYKSRNNGKENNGIQRENKEETVDSLRKKNAVLEKENACLLEEISKGQEHCSDIEETMKGDIDSIRSCLQTQINHLERHNRELVGKMKEEKDSKKTLQQEIEDLCKELDEINNILCKEREQRKKLENENIEMKRQEEYRVKFEGLDKKDSHYEEKGSLSKLVKKRSERWNVEVFELKKRIEELEKQNRELMSNLDKKASSVGWLREEFENKFKENSANRETGKSALETPEQSRTSNYNTPVKKFSARRLNISQDTNTPENQQMMLNEKERLIQKLHRDLDKLKHGNNKDVKKYEMHVSVLENEVALMKQQIKEKDEKVKSMSMKLGMRNDDGWSRVNHFKGLNGTLNQDSGVEIQKSSSYGMKIKSVEDLKDLVIEFERESSELQEIIEESKEAIFELTKALQGSEEVFLVDSKNNNAEIICNSVKFNRGENENLCIADSTGKDLHKAESASEKQSYILSRLSLTDIDVTAVLAKLRIAVSQLESRLEKCQSEKMLMEAKIAAMRGKERRNAGAHRNENDQEVVLESKTSRSAVIDIARKRDATIIDGTIDDLAHEENRQLRFDAGFEHGSRCRLLWQQLCDARASLSRYEREINRQKDIHHKHLAECQENIQKTSEVQKNIAEVGSMAKEQYDKQEYVITELEEKLVHEKKSSEMLQMRIDSSMCQLEDEQKKNALLSEKLEESRKLLYKHHKSNENKLDAIMNFMKNELIGQLKELKDADTKTAGSVRASPSNAGRSRGNSRNTSFHSPEANIEAELAAKKSRGHRTRGIEEQAYRTASYGYKTLDELDFMKSKMNGIQDHVKTLIGSIDQLQREKNKLQDERKRLVDRIYMKEEEVRKAESRVEAERRKVKDNEMEYRADFDALKVEQKEVYHQFNEVCNTVKRKDIELLNKTKQIKLLTAEWKEAEQKLNNQLESLRNENKTLWAENSELRTELEKAKAKVEDFVRKMSNAEEQLSQLYQKLSNLDNMFYECKQKALYQ